MAAPRGGSWISSRLLVSLVLVKLEERTPEILGDFRHGHLSSPSSLMDLAYSVVVDI